MPRPASPSLSVRKSSRVVVLCMCAALGASIGLVGCEDSVTVPKGTTGTSGTGSGSSKACTTLLRNLWSKAQPDGFGLTSSPESVAGDLNRYAKAGCLPKKTLSDDSQATAEALMLDGLVENLRAESYTERDARHLRTAMLLSELVQSPILRADSEPERVAKLFEYVCSLIALDEPTASDEARSPYFVLMSGRGTAADRVWVFAEAVRQLRLPVALLASDLAVESAVDWLVAVPVDGQVYLFDPLEGVALRDSGKNDVASWDAVVADPTAYPQVDTAPDQLTKTALIGHANWWSARSATLQTQLTGRYSVVVAAELRAADSTSGMFAELKSASEGKLDPERMTVWTYPEEQLRAFIDSGVRSEPVRRLSEELEMPLGRSTEVSNQWEPTHIVRRGRLNQVRGTVDDAIKDYSTAQATMQSSLSDLPVVDQATAKRTSETTRFWSASAQTFVDDPRQATLLLEQMLRQYEGRGEWTPQVMLALAQTYVAEGRTEKAVSVLQRLPVDAPGAELAALWTKRWDAQQSDATTDNTEKTDASDGETTDGDSNAPQP